MRILLIGGDAEAAEGIRRSLARQGYAVVVCPHGFEGEELAATEPYDAVLLDLTLPDRDGLDVCRNLRRREVTCPILIVTALSATRAKVMGLDAGADDYLARPFEPEELLARVRALVRRSRSAPPARLRYADLELDLRRRTAARAGERVALSSKEFALLEFLVRNAGRVVERHAIAERVWAGGEPASNVIEVCISSLRRKIDRDFETALIQTVVGTGYGLGTVPFSPAWVSEA